MAPARPHRVLVLTADKVGASMAGPAIRSVELARVLAGSPEAEATVTLASPHPVDRDVPGVRTTRYGNEAELHRLVDDADVVLAMAGLLHEHPWIGALDGADPTPLDPTGPGASVPAVIVDAYDPVLFERDVKAGLFHQGFSGL